ncbi:MAG: hypothetical protein JWQ19_948 [Subtercola sp.]|nr:hypothetical protein [Subtercola sp.]
MTVAPGSTEGTANGAGESNGTGGDQSIQRVGDAAVARVWVIEANRTTATAAEQPRPPLAPSAPLAIPKSEWAATHTAPSGASAVASALPGSGGSTASEPSAPASATPSGGSGSAAGPAGEASSGVGSLRKQPASALLVKGKAGWRIRAVFMPAG